MFMLEFFKHGLGVFRGSHSGRRPGVQIPTNFLQIKLRSIFKRDGFQYFDVL